MGRDKAWQGACGLRFGDERFAQMFLPRPSLTGSPRKSWFSGIQLNNLSHHPNLRNQSLDNHKSVLFPTPLILSILGLIAIRREVLLYK